MLTAPTRLLYCSNLPAVWWLLVQMVYMCQRRRSHYHRMVASDWVFRPTAKRQCALILFGLSLVYPALLLSEFCIMITIIIGSCHHTMIAQLCVRYARVHTMYCAVCGMRCLFIVIIWTWITPKSVAAKCHIQSAPVSAFWFIFNSYKYWWHVAEGKHTSTSRMQNLIKSGLAQKRSDTREPETSANCECLCRAYIWIHSP